MHQQQLQLCITSRSSNASFYKMRLKHNNDADGYCVWFGIVGGGVVFMQIEAIISPESTSCCLTD
jgi:hypothetical protein